MKVIYMLSGNIRSGKDYVADILVKNFDFKKYAFANILKKEVSESYNINIKHFTTQEGKSKMSVYGKTHRELLIEHANYKKLFDKNYYSLLLLKQIQKESFDKIVISDFRYPYEYLFLLENLKNFVIKTIKIERNTSLVTDLESENSLKDFDYNYKIDNNKDSFHIGRQLKFIFQLN